ncbi:cytochrome P450 [Kibdelosporangium aridum]|uniref:cytochrome P450 n=1 Tax=Kibdelosporangium aridum TaxID=2030 RepID=UPI00163CBBDC|nr:cytochrome P450 [Kibdelosporangium aridum]
MLTDPAFTIPPVPTGGPAVGIRWLRRHVARFANGADHDRRRLQVTSVLAEADLAGLRRLAAEHTRAVLDDADGRPVDLMTRVARVVPIDVLVAALGLPSVRAGAVAVVAKAYQPGSGPEKPADEAVRELVEAFGGSTDESVAAKIALLVQACDATAGLVGNAALAMLRNTNRPVETVVAETLQQNPPVRMTRRLAADTGTVVAVDLAASGLPFGAGPHQCPGRDHAIAITTGILESVQGCRLAEDNNDYEPSAALRVPAKLAVVR